MVRSFFTFLGLLKRPPHDPDMEDGEPEDSDITKGFPGQQTDKGEVVETLSPRHWMRLLPILAFLSFITLFFVLFRLILVPLLQVDFLYVYFGDVIFATIIFHYTFVRIFNYFLRVLIVTNFRILDIRHTVFLQRERNTIDLKNVQDIHLFQLGIIPRLFNYGKLIIYGANVDVEYHFHHVPDVQKLHSVICHVHRNAVTGVSNVRQKSLRNLPSTPSDEKSNSDDLITSDLSEVLEGDA